MRPCHIYIDTLWVACLLVWIPSNLQSKAIIGKNQSSATLHLLHFYLKNHIEHFFLNFVKIPWHPRLQAGNKVTWYEPTHLRAPFWMENSHKWSILKHFVITAMKMWIICLYNLVKTANHPLLWNKLKKYPMENGNVTTIVWTSLPDVISVIPYLCWSSMHGYSTWIRSS